MFLSHLSNSSKELFLKLCINAAKANNVVEEQEQAIIKAYCHEMNVPYLNNFETVPFDALLSQIKELPTVEKKIIIFEILALMKADNVYDSDEIQFINKLANACGFSEKSIEKYMDLLNTYTSLCKILYKDILDE